MLLPNFDDVVVGFIDAVTCVIISVLYIPCLKIIGTDKMLSAQPCFKLMFHLGLSDLANTFLHFIVSICMITGISHDLPFWLNKSLGATLNGLTWYSSTAFLHIIAFNRWATLTDKYQILFRVFSPLRTKMVIILVWAYSICWMALLLSPWASFIYHPGTMSLYFDDNSPWYEQVKQADWVHNQLMLWPSALWYLLTIIHIRAQRNTVGNEHAINRMVRKEQSVLRQAAIIFLYCMIGSQYWHLALTLYQLGFKYAFAFGNWWWLTNAGVNPIVYLTINTTIKRKVLAMFGVIVGPGSTVRTIKKQTYVQKEIGELHVSEL